MGEEDSNLSDRLMLMVIDHSLRRRIAREVVESAHPLSLAAISRRLEEPLSKISYHGRLLAEGEPPAITRTGSEAGPGGPRPLYEASKALAGLYPLLITDNGMPPTAKS